MFSCIDKLTHLDVIWTVIKLIVNYYSISRYVHCAASWHVLNVSHVSVNSRDDDGSC